MPNKFKENYKKLKLNNRNSLVTIELNNFKSENDVLDNLAQLLENGENFIQINPYTKSDKNSVDICKKSRQLCAMYDCTFIIKHRTDIAFLSEADGVILTENDINISDAKEILGENCIIGYSTHIPEKILKGIKNGVDYINIESINSTPTSSIVKSVGLEYAKWVSENFLIPIYICDNSKINDCQKIIKLNSP